MRLLPWPRWSIGGPLALRESVTGPYRWMVVPVSLAATSFHATILAHAYPAGQGRTKRRCLAAPSAPAAAEPAAGGLTRLGSPPRRRPLDSFSMATSRT